MATATDRREAAEILRRIVDALAPPTISAGEADHDPEDFLRDLPAPVAGWLLGHAEGLMVPLRRSPRHPK